MHEIEKKEVKRVVLSPLEKELRRRRNSQHFTFFSQVLMQGLSWGNVWRKGGEDSSGDQV